MPSFISSISKLTASRGLSFALGLIATPIVARLYLPEHFGVYGLVMAVGTWVSGFSALGYYQALPLAETRAENRALVRLCLYLTALLLIPITLVFGFGGGWVAGLMREPGIAPYLWFVPLLFIVDSFSNIADDALMKERRFGTISVVTFLEINLERLLTILWALLIGASALGLFMGNLIGIGLGASIALGVVVVIFYRNRPAGGYARFSLREVAKKHSQFPKIQMWTSLLKVSANRIPFFMLALFFGPATVGFFTMARIIVTMPMRLFGVSVDQVFYPEAAQEWQEAGTVRVSIQKAVKILSTMVVFPLLTITLLAPMFFSIAFGSRWYEAGILAQLLSLWVFANILTTPFSNVLLIVKKAYLLLWYSAAQLVVAASTLYLGGHLDSPRLSIALFSLGGALVYGHMFVICMRMGKGRAREVIKVFTVEILIALAILAPVTAVYYLTHAKWLCLGLYVLSALAYGLVMLKREPKIKEKIKSLIQHKLHHETTEEEAG